jgi:hypothetical protein
MVLIVQDETVEWAESCDSAQQVCVASHIGTPLSGCVRLVHTDASLLPRDGKTLNASAAILSFSFVLTSVGCVQRPCLL